MVMAHQKQRHLQGHVKDILPANQLGKKFCREIKVFNTAETSLSVKYNVGIHSVVHRQTAAEMGSFPRPGTGVDTHDTHRDSAILHVAAPSKDYRIGSAVLPMTTQIAYSMWKACMHTELK